MKAWLLLRILLHIAALLAGCGIVLAQPACPGDDEPFPSLYRDAAPFRQAIEAARDMAAAQDGLTGVTVPHHLVAADLIASGIAMASGSGFRRVVLLFPDHFRRVPTGFATTAQDIETVLGTVRTDRQAVAQLLQSDLPITRSCLFADDHGIHALLPFVSHYLPDAAIVPVAIGIGTRRADWDRLVTALLPLLDDETLVLQSTDFSHYLPHARARQSDQETLNVLAAADLAQLAGLVQPDHVDSAGALYVQTALQARRFGAAPEVVFNRNQQEGVPRPIDETTSYLVAIFRAPGRPAPEPPGSTLLYLAGDTMFGRSLTRLLVDEKAARRVEEAVLSLTGGHPLVVNLEGVLLPHVPEGIDHMTLAMPAGLAIDWLQRLNVAAVGLANNHAADLGEAGQAETRAALQAAGLPVLEQGQPLELPGLTLFALTDIGTNHSGAVDLIEPALMERLAQAPAEKPVLAYVHWGREYVARPSEREEAVTAMLLDHGVAAIIGAHPHVAGEKLESLAGGGALRFFSLGNFLFDQTAETSSGALVELRLFDQGTYYARLLPLPNLYDLARGAQQPPKPGSR